MEFDNSSDFRISSLWNGEPVVNDERVILRVRSFEDFLLLDLQAPFHGDPPPALPPGPCWGLWDYEVVELFVVGKSYAYTEIELGPHGHHLVLKFREKRRPYERELPIDYEAEVRGDFWNAKARIPWHYLPEEPVRANAYAIHGEGERRRYLAAYPVMGTSPDFHRIEQFPELSRASCLFKRPSLVSD